MDGSLTGPGTSRGWSTLSVSVSHRPHLLCVRALTCIPIAAMRDFAEAQDEWYATWPKNIADRAMVVESVRMWQRC